MTELKKLIEDYNALLKRVNKLADTLDTTRAKLIRSEAIRLRQEVEIMNLRSQKESLNAAVDMLHSVLEESAEKEVKRNISTDEFRRVLGENERRMWDRGNGLL